MLSVMPSERYSELGSAVEMTNGRTASKSIALALVLKNEYAIPKVVISKNIAIMAATLVRWRLIVATTYSALEVFRPGIIGFVASNSNRCLSFCKWLNNSLMSWYRSSLALPSALLVI